MARPASTAAARAAASLHPHDLPEVAAHVLAASGPHKRPEATPAERGLPLVLEASAADRAQLTADGAAALARLLAQQMARSLWVEWGEEPPGEVLPAGLREGLASALVVLTERLSSDLAEATLALDYRAQELRQAGTVRQDAGRAA